MSKPFRRKNDIEKSRVEQMVQGIEKAKSEREEKAFKDFMERLEYNYRGYKRG